MFKKFTRLGLGALTSLAVVAASLFSSGAPAQASTTYYYAAGVQGGFGATEPTGLFSSMGALNPTLDSTAPNYEAHTLIELAMVQGSGATRQVMEVGLRKATGDTTMKVFAYLWKNGTGCGYSMVNLCGTAYSFHPCDTVAGVNNCSQTTDNWDLGQSVPSGTTMRVGIEYSGGDYWWTVYQSGGTLERLGWVDGAFYTSAGITFTSADEIWAFAEVGPGGGALGCTDVGDGVLPTSTTGAFIGSVSAPPVAVTSIDMDSATVVTDATKYNLLAPAPGTNVRTLRFSGPGAC